jgi:hypothetical protein
MIERKIITKSIKSQTIGSTDIYDKSYFQAPDNIYSKKHNLNAWVDTMYIYMFKHFLVNYQVMILIYFTKKSGIFY